MTALEEKINTEKSTLNDFTRKSVVGAVYRVGASFTLDALYLTTISALGYYVAKDMDFGQSVITAASDFMHNLEGIKLARVALFVVGINYLDYRFDVTNRLDQAAKYILKNGKWEN